MDIEKKELEQIAKNVEEEIFNYFSLDIKRINLKNLSRKETMARGFILYILHVDKNFTIRFLGRTYKRAPRTIYWSIEQTRRFISLYKEYRRYYEDICRLLQKD